MHVNQLYKAMQSKTFFSSDYHFGHTNIIKYDGRPFQTIQEMDEAIILRHNSIVSPEDTFYFLGDFSFIKDKQRIEQLLQRMNGIKFFIKGNHDHTHTRKLYAKHGTYLGELAEIEVEGQKIVLCHYAMKVWNKSNRGTWHLYGHSHGSLPDDPHAKSMDVGCMNNAYYPFSFEKISCIMASKMFKPKDHHVE